MYIDRELTILKTYQITTGLGLEMMALQVNFQKCFGTS